VPGKHGSFDRESRRVQRGGEVAESLGSVAEAVQEQDGRVARPAKIYGPRAGNQAGDSASWLRLITYDVPFRSATPAPTSRPNASEIDSRVAPTISQMSL
jgi:hypothetical protein